MTGPYDEDEDFEDDVEPDDDDEVLSTIQDALREWDTAA